ncbi:SWI5/SAE3 family protein [Aspergillus stella-maris]|uniref:SWI5/SAE3 family protein n=1 Tax=Aspergillus stella-maris TaxID=1810926 RepID=UPI003CCE2D97
MPPPPEKREENPTQESQRDKKLAVLRASIASLESQSSDLEVQIAEIREKLKNDPSETVKRHIRLLHEYNEIKDIGQGLMGLIADARGVRQVDVQREFGVGGKD